MKKLSVALLIMTCLTACHEGDQNKNSAKRNDWFTKADQPKINVQEAANPEPLALSSTDFQNQKTIPLALVCTKEGGKNQMPSLTWKNPPAGTQSFALVVTDSDASKKDFTHWMVYNIPSNALELNAKNISYAIQGKNSYGNTAYDGPCPPPGKLHHYVFTLYAFTEMFPTKPELELKAFDFIATQSSAVLEQAQITGIYQAS